MSFLGWTPAQARKPFAEVLPDGRKRLTRWIKASTTGTVPQELDFQPNTVDIWPQADTPADWQGLRLTYIQMDDNSTGFPQGAADSQPLIRLIYEEISETAETRVGANEFTQLPDGRSQVVQKWVMFSTSTYTPQTPGTSTATGLATYYLWTETNENDGTLRNITRTYQTAGTTATDDQSLQGGALLTKKISSFKTVPATPAGYTSVGTPVQNPNGYPVYDYTFAKGDGEVSRRFVNAQGGTTAFNATTPSSSVGSIRCIITHLTAKSITSNPVTGPASFVFIGQEIDDRDGYRVWTVTYGYGTGLITDETTISASGALVIYHRVQFGSAPTTPTATIGGTVTVFETKTSNSDGFVVYDYRWAEGDGQASIQTRGEPDGALIYTITDYNVAATTPAYPGSGTAPLVSLSQKPENGYFVNTAVYHKIPASQGFRKMVKFVMPGLASISGAPVKYTLSPPVTRELLATVTVDYDTTQVTTTPFSVTTYATLNTQWIPYTNPGASPTPGSPPADTTTGPPQGTTESLGGYLASSSGTSGSNAFFNGVFCLTYEQTLGSSTPSTRPTGATTIAVDNDPYLVATDGTVYFRRTVTTYTF